MRRGRSQPDDGFIWPKASPQAETWRYEALRGCVESLKQQLYELDPKYKLQASHKESLKETQQMLHRALLSVTSREGGRQQAG